MLTRIAMPYRFYPHDSQAGRQLLREAGQDGSRLPVVIFRTGRRLGVPSLEALAGAGVFYGAAGSEARAMDGCAVFVTGAGNSAGQAAIHLASHAASVTMLVRADTLAKSMSDYLIQKIQAAPNIFVRLHTEAVGGQGARRLEQLTLRDSRSRATHTVPAAALFVLIGAQPPTQWLQQTIECDRRGYVLTGRDLAAAGPAASWPLARPPPFLETSLPGVFAAGHVRHRSVKRVASAVGEDAIAIQLTHEYLAEELLDIGDESGTAPAQQPRRGSPLVTSSTCRRSHTSLAGVPSRQGTPDSARTTGRSTSLKG
jgi:thioredoxin reductase (NADPH)